MEAGEVRWSFRDCWFKVLRTLCPVICGAVILNAALSG